MRTVICGGRDYRLGHIDRKWLTLEWDEGRITTVITGGCRGLDGDAEQWAHTFCIPVEIHRADWRTHGKAAGPIRNKEMAEACDRVIAFPGGRGTLSMVLAARAAGKPVAFQGESP